MPDLPPPLPPRVPPVPGAAHAGLRPGRDRHMMPVVISTGVFPGLGQLLQRRWTAGILLTGLFLGALALTVREALVYLRLFRATDLLEGAPPELLEAGLFSLGAVLLLLFIHVVIVADVLREARRRRKADAEAGRDAEATPRGAAP